MSTDRDFDHLLDEWFADGPREAADRVVISVADRIERQSQRPAWRLLRRSPMRPAITYGLATAAVLVAAVVGYNLLQRGPAVGGPLPTATMAPTLPPSVGPSAAAGFVDGTQLAVPITLTLSGGWTYGGVDANNLELFWNGQNVDLGFHPISRVTLPGAKTTDPWIPVPADFAAWVQQRPEWKDYQTRPVTVGGRPGTEIDAAFVWDTGMIKRDFLRYTTGAWLYDQYNVGHRIRFIVVPGTSDDGLMIVVNAPAADFDAAAAALDGVLASVHFTAPTAAPVSMIDPGAAGSDIPAALLGTYSEGDWSTLAPGSAKYSWEILAAGDTKCVDVAHLTTSCIVITRQPNDVEQYGPAAVRGDLLYYRMVIHNFGQDPCLNQVSVWRFKVMTDRVTTEQLDPGCRNSLDQEGLLLPIKA